MDDKLLAVLIGLLGGATGYWCSTFWMKPILAYKELWLKVAADFIYYGQVINAEGLNDGMQKLYDERVLANRRNSADLAACLTELPFWYRSYLRVRGQKPELAARRLIGFSNTTDYELAEKQVRSIKLALGLAELDD